MSYSDRLVSLQRVLEAQLQAAALARAGDGDE
jgi:hypothetical protein